MGPHICALTAKDWAELTPTPLTRDLFSATQMLPPPQPYANPPTLNDLWVHLTPMLRAPLLSNPHNPLSFPANFVHSRSTNPTHQRLLLDATARDIWAAIIPILEPLQRAFPLVSSLIIPRAYNGRLGLVTMY